VATIRFETFNAPYVRIQNKGISSVDMLTVVGATSARGHSELIGQFGSGWKFTVALFLRKSIDFKVFLGKNGYEFDVDEVSAKAIDDDVMLRKVFMKQISGQGRKRIPMQMEIGFGALDWRDEEMGLREMICNAMDASMRQFDNYDDVLIEGVESNQLRAKDGYTNVYIQMTTGIRRYLNELYTYVPALNPHFDSSSKVITKTKVSPAKVYRKGVLVGTFANSLFDYNISDIELKESRNVSESNAMDECARALSQSNPFKIEVFLECQDDVWEKQFSSYTLRHNDWQGDNDTRIPNWKKAIERTYGADPVFCETAELANKVRRKGFNARYLEDSDKIRVVTSYGFKKSSDVLTQDELQGRELFDPSDHLVSVANKVWNKLVELGVTEGKKQPPIKTFNYVMNSGSEVQGYYNFNDGYIGISKDIEDSGFKLIQVLIEEFCHYTTNARDETRDFQDVAFKIAARLMEESFN
jgi:hypothetical protein